MTAKLQALLRRNCTLLFACADLKLQNDFSHYYYYYFYYFTEATTSIFVAKFHTGTYNLHFTECIFKKRHNGRLGCPVEFWKLTFICFAASVDLIILHYYQSCIVYFFIPFTCVGGEDLGFVCKQCVSSYSLSTK